MRVFQLVYGSVPTILQEYLDSVKKIYNEVIVYKFEVSENPVNDSDNFRIKILQSYNDILYIDWDIRLTGELTLINNGLPCFEYYRGIPDYGLIYSPHKEFWLKVEKERDNRGIDNSVYGWPRKILRGKECNEIKGNFEHIRYSSSHKII